MAVAAERGEPARQVLAQRVEHLVGLFEKHIAQLVVHRLFPGRGRQQAGGDVTGGRVNGRDRAGEDLGNGLRGADQRLAVIQFQQLVLSDDFFEQRHFEGVRSRRIAQPCQALLGHVEHLVARRLMIFEHALQVILDTGDGVGQAIELNPGGTGFVHQQVFLNVFVAGGQQAGRTGQRDHGQRTTNLHDQRAQRIEPLPVPLAVDVIEDHILGLLQHGAGFANHQLMNLRQVGGRQAAFFAADLLVAPGHAGKGRFDVEQGTRHIHQRSVAGLALPLGQTEDHRQLIDDHLARLAETQHRQGIGNLPQRRQQRVQLADMLTVAAHEHVEPFLDPDQPFAQGHDHRTHGVTVRTGHAGALLVDHVVAGQGIGQRVLVLEVEHLRRQAVGLGDIEQQAFQQLFGGGLIDAGDALLGQPLEFLVGVLQQAAQRRAVGEVAVEHGFNQGRGDPPERTERRVFAQLLKPGKHLGHVTELGLHALLAHQAGQRRLQGLAQLAQQVGQFRGIAPRQLFVIKRRHDDQLRGEQAGFREQTFAPRAAQVIEQWQDHQRQVAARGMNALQVNRQLTHGLDQQLLGLDRMADTVLLDRQRQLLDFLGQQRGAVELDHLQTAVNLMHQVQAPGHRSSIGRVFDEQVQRLTGLAQRFGDLALQPLKSNVIVTISHDEYRPLPNQGCS
ncbi:hypothetical protein ALQ76_05442 [Pseudomonas syringae pv. atrofaciens]|nr:hypothetical protein ALQ76_05442 [Pseudomonas syringae pv. atrofaciens]